MPGLAGARRLRWRHGLGAIASQRPMHSFTGWVVGYYYLHPGGGARGFASLAHVMQRVSANSGFACSCSYMCIGVKAAAHSKWHVMQQLVGTLSAYGNAAGLGQGVCRQRSCRTGCELVGIPLYSPSFAQRCCVSNPIPARTVPAGRRVVVPAF